MSDATDSSDGDRRRPTQPALRQPVQPVKLRATVGGRSLVHEGRVVSLNDRTLIVELGEASMALAVSLASEVQVDVDLGGGPQVFAAVPGRRDSDIDQGSRVELVLTAG